MMYMLVDILEQTLYVCQIKSNAVDKRLQHFPPLLSLKQAIQDITRNRDVIPEEIVALIYEKIDVNGEGECGYLNQFLSMTLSHYLGSKDLD